MERVKRVLDDGREEIIRHLMVRHDLERAVAGRFVDAAGAELIASWQWQASELRAGDLASWVNVQRLMGGMNARELAGALELDPESVWQVLRSFVPRVLIMARQDGSEARHIEPRRKKGGTARFRGALGGWPQEGIHAGPA